MLSRIQAASSMSLRVGYRYCSSLMQQRNFKLGVIGGGQMATAIISAIQAKNLNPMKNVTIYDVNEARLKDLKAMFDCNVTSSMEEVIAESDVIMLACKPQNLGAVALSIKTPPKGTVLSILAGVKIADLQSAMQTMSIVRCMPNTPATVLQGISVWCAAEAVEPHIKSIVADILSTTGEGVEVHDENFIDMATAVSGSGPAYVFLTMEAMVDAAVHMGFPRVIATKLVIATLKGSAVYAQESDYNLATLRNNVTSPGGTTASALYALEKGGYRTVVADAMWAAYRRALELGDENPNVGPGRNKLRH